MRTSKLSSKNRITLPKTVRVALGVGPGDTIIYEIEGAAVRIERLEPFDAAFHKALSKTLSEWASDEDEKAFSDFYSHSTIG
jgi:AbrB family looped-hinge helix DNA binding protein